MPDLSHNASSVVTQYDFSRCLIHSIGRSRIGEQVVVARSGCQTRSLPLTDVTREARRRRGPTGWHLYCFDSGCGCHWDI